MRQTFRKVDVPEGKSGKWEVRCFVPEGFSAALHNIKQSGRGLVAGETYTQLIDHAAGMWSDVIMSDTPAEIRDLHPLREHLHGRLLINGLGLGVALQGVLDKPEVEHVTIVELSEDVITLVAGHYKARYGNRLTIVHADALEWKSPKGAWWDAVWHDIWPTISGDNWKVWKRCIGSTVADAGVRTVGAGIR